MKGGAGSGARAASAGRKRFAKRSSRQTHATRHTRSPPSTRASSGRGPRLSLIIMDSTVHPGREAATALFASPTVVARTSKTSRRCGGAQNSLHVTRTSGTDVASVPAKPGAPVASARGLPTL